MKPFLFALYILIISIPAQAFEKLNIDFIRLNSPECTRYLNRTFKVKASEAYQICSLKKTETKLCLLEKSKNSDKDFSACLRK